MALVLILVVVFGYLAWTRYLHLQETALLLAHEDKWQDLLESKHRARLRSGALGGVVLLLLGGAMLVWMIARASATASASFVTTFGVVIASGWFVGMGVAMVVAYALWSRRLPALTPASESELWNMRSGLLAGIGLTLFGALLLVMGLGLPTDPGLLVVAIPVTIVGLVVVVFNSRSLRRFGGGPEAGEARGSGDVEETR